MGGGLRLLVTGILVWLPTSKGVLRKSSECNDSLGCIINPEADIMLTWQPNAHAVHFTLRGYIHGDDVYVAMGLSSDPVMGDDDVTECVHTEGRVRVFSSYNIGKSNARYADGALTNRSGQYDSGTIQCHFTRPVQGGGQEAEAGGGGILGSPSYRHDLRKHWHIMLVWGQLSPGTDTKQQHTSRSVTSHAVSLRAVGSFETQKLSDALIHVHGMLMMISWVALASVGVVIARHYKGLLPGTQLWGKDVWFQIHRAVMVLVVLLTCAGVTIIFVQVGGYREITKDTELFAILHPILGLVVTGLAVLNPILALFRPAPKAPRRPVFNWVHRCIGTGAHVFAVVAMLMGLMLRKVSAPWSMLFAVIAFSVWHVAIEAVFFCIVWARNRNNDRRRESTYAVQVKQDGLHSTPRSKKVSVFQEILLMMHCAVAIATTIFLISVFVSKWEDH